MGLEARCAVTWQGTSWTAAIHLDSAALEVRGRPRLAVPLSTVRHVSVADGLLKLETAEGALTLELGAAAELWARKIAAPPSRGKKLGIKPGLRVSLVGLGDAEFEAELVALGAELVGARAKADIVFLNVDAPGGLAALVVAKARIEPAGAIWVIRTKGKSAKVSEGDVREAARAAGLVDVKVAAFSDALSADKLVIPAAQRPLATSPQARAKKTLAREVPVGKRNPAARSKAKRRATAR